MDQKRLVNYLNSFLGYNRHNGVTVVEVEDGRCVVEVKLSRNSLNPQGNAHGGLIFSLADTAGGCAALSHGRGVVTLNGNVNYIRPGAGEYLRATAEELHYGSKTAVYRVTVRDDKERTVGEMTMTYFVTDKILEM